MVKNIIWLVIDKVLRAGLTFALMVWIAKYLGPEEFGLWNYTIAFVALFSIFSTLGLDSVVIKELVQDSGKSNSILGAAFFLKFWGGLAGVLLAAGSILLVRPNEEYTLILVSLIASGFIFQSLDVVDFYFQSQLKSRFTVIARNAAFLIGAILKVILLLNNGELIHFVLVNLLELALTAVFLAGMYTSKVNSLISWKIDKDIIAYLLKNNLPLTIAGMVILIYMRLDQIMLGQMVGDKAVGIYAAAVRLSEVWWFIPLIISNSLLPSIIRAKKESIRNFHKQVQRSLDITATLGIATAILISLSSEFIINFLYDSAYAPAAPILVIHTWTSIFVFMSFASTNWFITNNMQKFMLYKTLAGAVINLVLNYLLIPFYGGLGAAISTLVAQFVSSYFFNLFTKKTYPMFRMQTIALLKVAGIYAVYNYITRPDK
ncbi:flippase [Pontibacter beigongshangensis]|uniref:flippase n=1 Tax=Pontibacter beigongshangensis TaxID=2574733 RepID=UPI00164F3595|nr:oligosaccharide flippase family protein [Pontibacter beigongshangensis]